MTESYRRGSQQSDITTAITRQVADQHPLKNILLRQVEGLADDYEDTAGGQELVGKISNRVPWRMKKELFSMPTALYFCLDRGIITKKYMKMLEIYSSCMKSIEQVRITYNKNKREWHSNIG